jgi:hypothetical protein
LTFDDDELGSCINALAKLKINTQMSNKFCNGGDRGNDSNIPEMSS